MIVSEKSVFRHPAACLMTWLTFNPEQSAIAIREFKPPKSRREAG